MVLRRLELRHFRNLGVQELTFPPEGVAVVGDNAQGKTNLLEAIYYLESFRSFRGAGDGELTAFSEDVFYVRGSVDGEEPATVAAGFDRRTRSKKVTVDGSDTIRISAALGRLGAVVFSTTDTELVAGGPSVRRRFLDIALSLNRSGYLEALQEYRRTLAQRNAALRTDGGGLGLRDRVRPWERGLVKQGARLTRMRQEWVSEWGGHFARYYETVSGGDSAAISYRPNLRPSGPEGTRADVAGSAGPDEPAPDEDALREVFIARLDERWQRDSRLGVTSAGPHRDELLVTIDTGERTLPARAYGSGGQRRTAALALRLTEAATIRKQRGAEPILLIDDAFAELDSGRSGRLAGLLAEEGTGQVILTVPKEADVRLPGRSLGLWHIRDGVIAA